MWRRLYDRRGQSTGEYALVFAIILGAIVAMQTYVKRGVQGRVKSGTDYMARETANIGDATQYDPYYYTSQYETRRDSQVQEDYNSGQNTTQQNEDTVRAAGGFTEYTVAEEQVLP